MLKRLFFITFLLLLSGAASAHSFRVVTFVPSLLYYNSFYYGGYSSMVRPVYFTPYPKSYAASLEKTGEALRYEWESYRAKQPGVTIVPENEQIPALDGSSIIPELNPKK